MKKISDILIIKPSSLGDIFHAFPAVAQLRRHFPDAGIDWMVNPEFADAIDFCPSTIRRKIIFPRRELADFSKFIGAFWRLTKELRSVRYQMVIDFQGLFRSAFFGWLAHADAQYGFANPKEFSAKLFYHRRYSVAFDACHAIERNLSLAKQLPGIEEAGSNVVIEQVLAPVPRFSEAVDRRFEQLKITQDDHLIGICPGARWQSKCWPAEFFTTIIRAVAAQRPQTKFLILGSAAERRIGIEIAEAAGGQTISLTGETGIGELIEIIRRCRVLVSNDSGPIHIAAAAQVPVFAFFGPTDPELTGPYGSNHQVFRADVECLKCFERKCPRHDNICHKISSEEVSDALIKHITSQESK
ncbi:MAG: lipopolysaccharide heptosyltransferase II [Lentisphaerae bacterium]|nr:lipopolysaccharide heptosyltransferase II [Victivallaceae bacterium]MDD3703218.1 lipopolysaccharide heptosyltransferase II [Victivallaceae bacterium]MDD5662648.1 lipopolysaccharide heptosyltransferase II [Victivallaceae bacterium]NLK82956.1 lipopolysaccharide heptosyltransferase II [Lentisphaerota bacterium]